MRRLLTRGAPAQLNWEEPAKNKLAFIRRGNSPSLLQHPVDLQKALVKEVRNSNLMPMARWACTCSAFGHHVPQHIRVQKGGKPRLIWNGTTKENAQDITMNETTNTANEAEITFGYVYMSFCIWLWNLRITYPNEDILLAFIDISSCFRFPRIFADLVGAFGFIIGPLYYAANAMVFGSVASASSWKPFRIAIAAIATAYFFSPGLIKKHKYYLDMVKWDVPPDDSIVFVQAPACSQHPGIITDDGSLRPTPHEIYVDDNLIADTRRRMRSALAAAIESIFTIMGTPLLQMRQCAVALDKWCLLFISHRQKLIGLIFDTRRMTVGTPDEFRQEVLDLINSDWTNRHRFDVSSMETLIGKIGRIGQAFRPIYHLMPHMYSSVAYALRENTSFLMTTSRKFRGLMKTTKARNSSTLEEDEREINFAIGQIARKTHKCKQEYIMPASLKQEITFVKRILADTNICLSTPIAHIVKRDWEFEAGADACKRAGSGWSVDLRLWWHVAFPDEVIRRAYLPNGRSKLFISINVLEMVCVIINFAGIIFACWHDEVDLSHFPVLLNWCDNTSSCSWVNKKCKDSLIGRALGRFFCGLLLSTNIGIQAEWLSTVLNIVADDISRVKLARDDVYDYSQLFVDHPQLRTCRQFQPSDTLLTMIWNMLLNRDCPDPLTIRMLKPETLGSFISSSI